MARGDDIQNRLIKFAADIIFLISKLPETRVGNHLSLQILKSGTSPAANYAEARSSEVWLSIIQESGILDINEMIMEQKECKQLCRIINASIKTVKNKGE
jgi:hypothetical protein